MSRIERFLLQLTIFLIPSNLALHWYHSSTYYHGVLVDYLLPKLYLSDLPILVLLLWFFPLKSFLARHRYLLIFFLYLLITSIFSPRPLPSLWLWFKFLEIIFFISYLRSKPPIQLKKLLFTPILVSLLIQIVIGYYQYIKQSSLFGYILLGEPSLKPAAAISTSLSSGTVKFLPYGTTPHPNILAGYIFLSIIFLLIYPPAKTSFPYSNITKILAICLSIPLIFITESLTIISLLCLLPLILYFAHLFPKRQFKSFIPLALFGIPLLFLLFRWLPYHSLRYIDNASIFRRYRLLLNYLQVFFHHLLTGTGLNQSLLASAEVQLITTPTPFLQPVHNLFFLWITETGLLGSLPLAWFVIHRFPLLQKRLFLLSSLPLLSLLFIGCFDHYPLTLQTGQLLLALALAIF